MMGDCRLEESTFGDLLLLPLRTGEHSPTNSFSITNINYQGHNPPLRTGEPFCWNFFYLQIAFRLQTRALVEQRNYQGHHFEQMKQPSVSF